MEPDVEAVGEQTFTSPRTHTKKPTLNIDLPFRGGRDS